MSSSRLTRQVTGLLLSLAILPHGFVRTTYSASPSPSTGPIFTALTPLPTDEADMVIYAAAQPSAVESGGSVDLDCTVYNYGPDEEPGATLTTTLPPDVEVNTAETPAGSCTLTPVTGGGTLVTCPLGEVESYQAQTATINVTVNSSNGTNLQLALTADGTLSDPVAANDTANVLILVRAATSGPGGKLAFVTYRDGDAEIYLTNADGSGLVNLTNNEAYDWEPAWSPDGTKLVFNSDRSGGEEVWLMDDDGGNPTRLTTNGSNGVNFAWSPDGTKIAWQNWDGGTDNYDICVVNADGTGFSNLTNDADYQDKPQWSPDGTKILYEDYGSSYIPDVFVMNSDGSGKTNLTNTPDAGDFAPVWSPDGTKIAFARGDDDQGVYVMDADGSDQVNLTQTDYDGYPSWSPDGARIAFTRFSNSADMIFVMDSDGSDQAPAFTANLNGGTKVEWSPDGSGLVFDTSADGDSEIYVVNSDGGGLTNVSGDGDYDFEARWQPAGTTSP